MKPKSTKGFNTLGLAPSVSGTVSGGDGGLSAGTGASRFRKRHRTLEQYRQRGLLSGHGKMDAKGAPWCLAFAGWSQKTRNVVIQACSGAIGGVEKLFLRSARSTVREIFTRSVARSSARLGSSSGRAFSDVFFCLANFKSQVSHPAAVEAIGPEALIEACKPLLQVGFQGYIN
jgi:hypothetical protein